MRTAVKIAAAVALLVLAVVGVRVLAHRRAEVTAEAEPERRIAQHSRDLDRVSPLPATVRAYADAADRAVGLRDELCRCDGRACLEAVQDRFVATLGDTRLDPQRAAAYDEAVRSATHCIVERSGRP